MFFTRRKERKDKNLEMKIIEHKVDLYKCLNYSVFQNKDYNIVISVMIYQYHLLF